MATEEVKLYEHYQRNRPFPIVFVGEKALRQVHATWHRGMLYLEVIATPQESIFRKGKN